uniref:Uncharacterized protein n=1 Tax=Panagrolaimus davidi TaxID=227884 RepID=A0A914QVE6_9BILA
MLTQQQNYFHQQTRFTGKNSSLFSAEKNLSNFGLQEYPALRPRADSVVDWPKKPTALSCVLASNLNALALEENDKKRIKKEKHSSVNNSTLSFHIAAYAANESVLKINKIPSKSTKAVKFTGLKLNDENVFEIPRQQENQPPEPETMHYLATQRLLNPAQISLTQAAKIFLDKKNNPGAQYINWRTQIFEATGFPDYIKSNKILQNPTPLKKKTEYLSRRNERSTWDNVFIEVGDPEKWEKQLNPEFGPNIETNKHLELLIQAHKEGQKKEAEKDKEHETLLLELEKSTKMNEDFLSEIQMHRDLESELLEKIEELHCRECKKDKEHAKIVKRLEKLTKLNKDKANKLNYRGFTSAAGPSRKQKSEEPPSKKAKVMENGREYSMEFVMLCIQLAWMGIKDLKIPSVLQLITQYFDVAVERFPDQSTVTRWCNEYSIFVDQQIKEFWDNAENLTLHSDETTLSGDKLQAYIICKIVNGIRTYMVVGIEQVPDKSAARSLTAFLACMRRSVDVFCDMEDDVIEEILTERLGKIVNTVGDRASTQKLFDRKLGERTGNQLNEIFCQHHILASSWDVFLNTCLLFEKTIFNNPNLKASKIKAASEAISTFFGERSGSNQKAKEWKTFAEKEGLDHADFPSKLGSPWNIGFSILAVLYYHHKSLLKFLKQTNYKTEGCFAALMEVLESPAFMNMVRIGAAIDQVVNGPWWTEIESDKHISEISIINNDIIKYLETVAENPQLIDTELPLLTPRSERQTILRNHALSQFNSATLDMVPVFYQKIAEYLKKQFQHLSNNP